MTRPADAAAATAARLRALGHRPVLAPLLQIAPLPAELPAADAVQAILVTSAQAMVALGPAYHGVPLLAVGDASAARGRARGHSCVHSAAGNADDLAELAARHCDPAGAPLLLLSGAGEGGALAAALAGRFRVEQRFVYAATPLTAFPADAAAALRAGQLGAALFFSAATATAFVTLAEAAGLRDTVRPVEALAISAATATALAGLPWRCVRVAPRPNQDEMLALLR